MSILINDQMQISVSEISQYISVKTPMRKGTGRIYTRPQQEAMRELSNTPHLYSQHSCSKTQKNTNMHSVSGESFQTNSVLDAINSIHNNSVGECGYSPQQTDGIVRKLLCLNNIFKNLKELKEQNLRWGVSRSVSSLEDRLIHLERLILKESHV